MHQSKTQTRRRVLVLTGYNMQNERQMRED